MARSREEDAARKREVSASAKDVVIPPCEDPVRRKRLEADDEAWLLYYFSRDSGVPDPFWYEFVPDQKEMIAAIRTAVITGGDQSIAATRGEGKTTICERQILKYTLQGISKFSVLFAATGEASANSLDAIKEAIEENDLLWADYPEACEPVRAMENTPNRAHYMTVSGNRFDNGKPFVKQPAKFSWCGREITLPKVPGSPSSRSIIATRGLDAAVRGLKKKGRRPQVAIIDDPDTEETARSEEQADKLETRIDRAIGGMGGQQRAVARVMLTTLQSRISASYKFTDPEQKPSWKGRRFRFLVKPPNRKDMWDEYIHLRSTDWMEKTDKAAVFYRENRDAMDSGAVVANPHRYTDAQESALQFYYDQVARIGPEAVATEYDNDPPEDEGIDRLLLTAHHIQHSCLSGLERRIIPDETVMLTCGADVQKRGLHWVVIAWDANAAGCVVDYDFFSFGTEGQAASDCELAILEGLWAWHAMLEEHPYTTASGEVVDLDQTLIDMGWKDKSWASQPVQIFCNGLGRDFLASKGMPRFRTPNVTRTSKHYIGDQHYIREGETFIAMNTDHWKLKVHEGFLCESGLPGSLSMFQHPNVDGRRQRNFHLSYSKHITAESWETRLAPGFKRPETKWWHFGKPNHYFDATYQAFVARAFRGLNALASADVPSAAKDEPPKPNREAPRKAPQSRRRINFRRRA